MAFDSLMPFVDLRVIPRSLVDAVHMLEERHEHGTVRRAVFDLDNTLLVGDIGEAVFARLLLDKEPVHMSWTEYRRLVAKDPARAYRDLVDAMRGLEVETVIRTTLRVMTATVREWSLEGALVTIPRPHPVMRALISLLENRGYSIHVVTASNQTSARVACSEWFGIPDERVHGIRSVLEESRFTDRILTPVPIGEGKRDVFRTFVGTDDPIIAGGDSLMDVPLLSMVRPGGLILWMGEEKVTFEQIKGRIGGERSFLHLHRPGTLGGRPALAVA